MPLNQTRLDFIKKYGNSIVKSTLGTSLFPSVMMAQAILESSRMVGGVSTAGASELSRLHNNFFGIKDQPNDEWHGLKVEYKTREVIDGKGVYITDSFRAYPTALDGFRDRNKFLIANPRYKRAGVFDAKTPEEQAIALREGGYATDPTYGILLLGLVKSYNLKELDERKIALQTNPISAKI